ncbi:CDP-2,3-bis-(O-geranylgeranyl)-sn-glycerol synthase [Salinirubellus sp. GCM10025818]|jgi:CDP-2,3-bis-(O-geranylgeranyl)-sn-glycerol synthase|uniref:CDP-2,3-bis-(O-geranylgeranyl)-sn-glycerol synthase n=1 Tax=Salinirubellus TaxID=2162630 RepID=UPI0030D2F85C
MVLEAVGVAFWTMLPAYVPNNAAVLFGGGPPIDGGRTLGGRRLLGDGKTWRGTFVGTGAGALLALALDILQPTVVTTSGLALPTFPPLVALSLSAGAMLGDIAASFAKRRTGRERGAAFPVVDQLDFVAGALVLTLLVRPGWFLETFTPVVLAVVVVMTPLLHVGTNAGAYLLGLKDEPY